MEMSKARPSHRDPRAAPSGGRAPASAAYAACVVAALYAVVSFYWALGGSAGVDTLGGSLEELARDGDPVVLWLAGAAGVLKVAGAVLALALVRPWGQGALVLAGAVDVSGPVDRTALWWHVAVWDLWFLVWGVLLGLAAWLYGRR